MFNTADGFLTAATWSHVAAWYDGVSAGIAIDGVTLASMVCTEGPVAPAFGSRFNIGGMWDGTTVTESFNGRIDELRVWHAAPQGVAERANKVHQIVTLTDSTRHNTIGGRTLNRNVPVLTINKQRAESKIMVQWSMTIGVDNDNVQIMWRTGSVTGTIVNVAGASHGHTNRSGACSTNAGFFIDDTRATGAISYYFTYGRGAGADNNTRLVVNCNANESGSYQQSSSTYVLSEIL